MDEIKTRRRGFLWVLCCLSFVANTGLIFINILLLLGGEALHFIIKIPVIDVIAQEEMHGNALYFLLKIAIHSFCIYTLSLILLLKRRGFFYYMGAQLLLLGIPFLFLSGLGFFYLMISVGVSSIFSFFFVMLFSLYIPVMTKQEE